MFIRGSVVHPNSKAPQPGPTTHPRLASSPLLPLLLHKLGGIASTPAHPAALENSKSKMPSAAPFAESSSRLARALGQCPGRRRAWPARSSRPRPAAACLSPSAWPRRPAASAHQMSTSPDAASFVSNRCRSTAGTDPHRSSSCHLKFELPGKSCPRSSYRPAGCTGKTLGPPMREDNCPAAANAPSTNLLRRQPHTWKPREQPVLRIDPVEEFHPYASGGLPIGRGVHDQPVHCLYVPVALGEANRQPVE